MDRARHGPLLRSKCLAPRRNPPRPRRRGRPRLRIEAVCQDGRGANKMEKATGESSLVPSEERPRTRTTTTTRTIGQTLNRYTAEPDSLRSDFFSTVWDQDTANVPAQYGGQVTEIAGALVAAGLFTSILSIGVATLVSAALLGLKRVPAQPLLWYRDDWPSGVPPVQLSPWGEPAMVGPAKAIYIQESRRDRRELYNADFRRWHWRICEEMLGFTFDGMVPNINKPLLLMVGEKDDYPDVHFLTYVKKFAQSLNDSVNA